MSRFEKLASLGVFALCCVMGLAASLGAQDAVTVGPRHYRVLFENDRVRLLEFSSKPGDKVGMHSHPSMVVYALTAYKVRHTYPDGSAVEREFKPGDSKWFEPFTHSGENIGSAEGRVLLFEMKDAPTKK
jgi:quercetin dioxygenase-like cupin family protein